MNERQKKMFAAVLRIAQREFDRGCPNATDEEIDSIIDTMNEMFSPTKEIPIGMYGVRSMLGGVTRETVQRKIAKGEIPEGFQIAGEGNKNFWFKSEIKKRNH